MMVAEVEPLPVQAAPVVVMATGKPELAVAVTLKLELKAAVAGALVTTVIVWLTMLMVRSAST
jgi:hypothetical protein